MPGSRVSEGSGDFMGSFASPSEIAAAHLSPQQKIYLLRQWEQDLKQQMTASREGMTPPDPNRVPEMMRLVRDLLRELGEAAE